MRRYWCLLVCLITWGVMVNGPAWSADKAPSAEQRCRLLFSDGVPLTRLMSTTDLKVVFLSKKFRGQYLEMFVITDPQPTVGKKGKKGPARPNLGLNPDGSFIVQASRAGKYALRLLGMDIAKFEVKKDELGLVIEDLPKAVRLPFSHIMRLSPPRRRVEVINPKTKKKRMKSVPVDIDWAQVEVVVHDQGKVQPQKLRQFKKYKGALLTGSGKSRFVLVSGPGIRPYFGPVSKPQPKYQGELGRRIIRYTLSPFKLITDKNGYKRVPGVSGYVHNVARKVYYWVAGYRLKEPDRYSLWLVSYNQKKQRGGAKRITGALPLKKGAKPTLYLDEKGGMRLFVSKSNSTNKQASCYSLSPGGTAAPLGECIYPAFEFRGRVIRGNEWIIPNLGGIPLQVGTNSISINGTVKKVNRTANVSGSYEIRVEGPVPHVTEMPKNAGHCTGDPTIWDAHSDDNRLCLDPETTASFIKGPPPKMPKDCEKSEPCMENYRKARSAHARYRPKPPHHAPMIKGVAVLGGYSYPYAQKVKYRKAIGYDKDNKPLDFAEHEEYVSGLPPVQSRIVLVTGKLGYTGITGPINLQEGPYPELRYRAQPVDPKTHRKISEEYEVIKVYPQNYQVRISGGEVEIDRSHLLKPPGPDQDSDDDGVSDDNDQCPNTAPNTPVDKTGCPREDGLQVLSPDSEKKQALGLAGPQKIAIKLRYRLDSAPEGVIRILAEHESGKLYSNDYPIKKPGGELMVDFQVTPPPGSPQFGVGIELLPAEAKEGPSERIYYYFGLGSMEAKLETEEEVAAHPVNETMVTATITGPGGAPIANREFNLLLLAYDYKYLEGGYLDQKGSASKYVTTDAQGKAQFLYIPPQVVPAPGGSWKGPDKSFPVEMRFEFRDRADTDKKAMGVLPLVSPFPKITKLIMPGGDRAGHWQDVDSTLVIEDADSKQFRIAIYGPGQFGYQGGRRKEKLVVPMAGSPFKFRFQSEPMGLDLNDIPTNWDVFKEFGMTNLKGVGRLAMLYGGNWLLRRHKVAGTASHSTSTSFKNKVFGGAGGKATAMGSDIDTSIVKKIRIVTKLRNPAPQTTWATKFLYRGDAFLGIRKNLLEGKDTIKNLPTDIRSGGGYQKDAVMDGVHTAVGFVDAFVAMSDLINAAPPNMQTELLKLAYENIKTGYGLLRKVQGVANSWEDVMYIPILVDVTDPEGHSTRRMVRYAVKFSKLEGQN